MKIEEIEQQYKNQYPFFQNFTKRLEQLLKTILDNSKIKYHLIESRAKSVESFCEKINKDPSKYTNPIYDVTDKCALRIIVFYTEDLLKIERIIKDNFIIDELNSSDTKNRLKENEFGYLSKHFVVSLNKNRSSLSEWEPYKEIKAEIQIRTVLQHAWAAISHELEYKKTFEIPSILKRRLFRLAGIIELADEQFQVVRHEHESVEFAIANNKYIENVKIFDEINLNTIKNFFKKNENILKKITEEASQIGFKIMENDSDRNLSVLSDIINLCKILGINDMSEFQRIFIEITSDSKSILKGVFKYKRDTSTLWYATDEFLITLLILIYSKDKANLFESINWSNSTLERIKDYSINV